MVIIYSFNKILPLVLNALKMLILNMFQLKINMIFYYVPLQNIYHSQVQRD